MSALLDAIRVGLGMAPQGSPAPLSADTIELAARHGVVYPVLAAAPTLGVDDAAEALVDHLEREARRSGIRSVVAVRQVVKVIEAAGLDVLVIKGVVLGAQTGRSLHERHGLDVDLLIRPDDWLEADRALIEAGYVADPVCFPEIGDDWRSRFLRWAAYEKSYGRVDGDIDLHWRLTPGHPPGLDSAVVIARAVSVEVGGTPLSTLDVDTALAHVALHGAKDYWTRLRSTVDAHLLVAVAGASWERAGELVPESPAIAEARFGVDVLVGGGAGAHATTRSEPMIATPAQQQRWLDGVNRGHILDAAGRPAGGWVRYVARISSLTPGLASAAAVAASYIASPVSIARSRLPASLWWLGVLFHRPWQVLRRVVLGRSPSS